MQSKVLWYDHSTFCEVNQISDSLVASHMVSKSDKIFNDAFFSLWKTSVSPWKSCFLHTVHGLEMADVSVYERKQMLGGGGGVIFVLCFQWHLLALLWSLTAIL